MSTIVKRLVIPATRQIKIDLPQDVPVGEAIITVTVEPKDAEKKPNRVGALFGKGAGEIWMADDFDAPLDDFKDYM